MDKRKKYKLNLKRRLFSMYGSRCSCCQTTIRDFLTLEHIKGDGAQERRELQNGSRAGGAETYRRAVQRYRPDKYTILCMSCNLGSHKNKGRCPHQDQEDVFLAFYKSIRHHRHTAGG